MKRLLFLLCSFSLSLLVAQTPKFEWAIQQGGNSNDVGRGIATDQLGNVYVTGEFRNTADFDPGPNEHILTSAGGTDIFVAKYASDGQFLWAFSLGDTLNDRGKAISTDTLGNIYIVGDARGIVDLNPGVDSFYLPVGRAFLLKLNTDGDFIWTKRIAGSLSALAVDNSGCVYITGSFAGTSDFDPGFAVYNLTSLDSDFFILKLNSDGDFVWAKSMGGEDDDTSSSIALDSSNNVYTTGDFEVNADFDPGSGEFILEACGGQWERDVFISKLSSDGDFIWAKSIGDCSDTVHGRGITTSEGGEVYITGEFEGTLDFDPGPETFDLSAVWERDAFVLKLNTGGDFVWAKAVGSWSREGGNAIALDANNNVYTTGYFDGIVDFDPGSDTFNLTSDETDVFILKLDWTGSFVWAGGLIGNDGGIGNFGAAGVAITVDDWGNIFTTGSFTGTTDFDADISAYELSASGFNDAFIHKMRQESCISSPMINSSTDLSICPGETISLVASLPSSALNISYLWSTGDTSDIITIAADSSFILSVAVTYTNDTMVCNNSTSVEVVVLDSVAILISDDINICAQEEVFLEASGGISYLWSTGDTTDLITISGEDDLVYSVTVVDENGCTGVDSVAVIVYELADTTLLSFMTCDSLSAGIMEFVYFDQNGCDSIVLETTNFIPIPQIPVIPTDITIQENNPPFDLSVQEVPNASEYLWTVPAGVQILSGQGTDFITVDWNGLTISGSVCVSAINDCGASADACMEVTVEMVDAVTAARKKTYIVFPNPADEVIHLIFGDEQVYEIDLLNVLGQEINLKKKFVGQTHLDVKEITAGLYWIRLRSTDSKAESVFIKVKVI